MLYNNQSLVFAELSASDEVPYKLLLLADPSKELVDAYLKQSLVFVAKQNNEVLGVVVLMPSLEQVVEIKNIGVHPAHQGKGIGSYLLERVVQLAKDKKFQRICIGTANSSIGQLYLYQKHGFEITEVRYNFFSEHYPEPIYENGIQAKHMIVLTRTCG